MRLLLFALLVLFIGACNSSSNQQKEKPSALTNAEYQQLTSGDFTEFTKETFINKTIEERYNNELATYKVKVHKVTRSSESIPVTIVLEMEMDRVLSSLLGAGDRKIETKHFAIPSSKSSSVVKGKSLAEVKTLNFKDTEVFIQLMSEALGEASW